MIATLNLISSVSGCCKDLKTGRSNWLKWLVCEMPYSYLIYIFNHLRSLSTWSVFKHQWRRKKIKMKSDREEAPVCKMSYHLDQPHEPISVHQRWPSQSWQGTQRGWGSLDWSWRTRSSLALETRCPLAGPQQEPEATTMSSHSYCKHSAAMTVMITDLQCNQHQSLSSVAMFGHMKQNQNFCHMAEFTLVMPGKSTSVRLRTLGEKIFR